jgi:hypothetical protein
VIDVMIAQEHAAKIRLIPRERGRVLSRIAISPARPDRPDADRDQRSAARWPRPDAINTPFLSQHIVGRLQGHAGRLGQRRNGHKRSRRAHE